jgi:hypothetical protein
MKWMVSALHVSFDFTYPRTFSIIGNAVGFSSLPVSGGSNPSRLTTWLLVLVMIFNVSLKTNHHVVTKEVFMDHKNINAPAVSQVEINDFNLGVEMLGRGLVVPTPS